jgi:hypothetical protein
METFGQRLTVLIQDILKQVDSWCIPLVYIRVDSFPTSDYYHTVLKTMHDPQHPWRPLMWIRIVDYYHACLYIKQLAEAIFSPSAKGRAWPNRCVSI